MPIEDLTRPMVMPRKSIVILLIVASETVAQASIYETPNWALIGNLGASASYDSDLTLLRGGPSGYLLTASPSLDISRHGSDTDVKIDGGVTQTEFLSGGQPNETDLNFDSLVQYPNADNAIPIYKLEASWVKSSEPNEFVGERVKNELLSLAAQGFKSLGGELGIRLSGEYDSARFLSPELNDNTRAIAVVGLAYQRDPRTEFSVNFGAVLGHSTPNDPTRADSNVRSKEYDLTVRATGQITDKITGSFYGGIGEVNYSGGYSSRNFLPVAGADLTWGIDPRRTLVLAAYSGATYSPDGEAIQTTHAFLSYTDVVISGWQFTIRVGPTHTVFERQVELRSDNGWDVGTEFAYQPSTRIKVALDINYTHRDSTILIYELDHKVVSLGATYSF
jgi:hypothetical protein